MFDSTDIFWTCAAFAFVFGALIGSFLNVVIYRVPEGLSVVTPGSHCPSCDSPVRWYDNIPIISWFVLGGKCRDCKTPFSGRYAGVEFLTAVLALVAWWQVGRGMLTMELIDPELLPPIGTMFLLRFTFFALLVTITFIDLDHFLIPHKISLPGIAIGLASPWIAQWALGAYATQLVWPPVTPITSIVGAFLGFGIIVGLFYAYFAVRGVEGIGGGDATLMALIGAWLGWPSLLFVLFAASIQGLVAAGISMALGGDFAKDGAEVFADEPPENPDSTGESDDMEARSEDEVEQVGDEDDSHIPKGKLAVPFGPFLALAALEFAIIGPYLPEALSMIYLY